MTNDNLTTIFDTLLDEVSKLSKATAVAAEQPQPTEDASVYIQDYLDKVETNQKSSNQDYLDFRAKVDAVLDEKTVALSALCQELEKIPDNLPDEMYDRLLPYFQNK